MYEVGLLGGISLAFYSLVKDCVYIGFGDRSRSHLQPIIDWRIEGIDRSLNINVRSYFALSDRFFQDVEDELASRQCPIRSKCLCELRIELSFGKESPHQGTDSAAESFGGRVQLKPQTLYSSLVLGKSGGGAELSDKGLHDDRCLVRPTAIDGGFADTSLCCDCFDAHRSKAYLQNEIERCFQNCLMKMLASRPAAPGCLCVSSAHLVQTRPFKNTSSYYASGTIRSVSYSPRS